MKDSKQSTFQEQPSRLQLVFQILGKLLPNSIKVFIHRFTDWSLWMASVKLSKKFTPLQDFQLSLMLILDSEKAKCARKLSGNTSLAVLLVIQSFLPSSLNQYLLQLCFLNCHDRFLTSFINLLGLHLEDQVFPKRCGHLDGKTLITADDMAKKVEIAAQASKECSEGEFVICARTDARGVYGIEETIKRSKLYIDAGADMIFPEGLATKEEFEYVAKELKGYGKKGGPFLLANMTEFGKTPIINVSEFEKMGYNCVIFPVSTLRITMKAVDDFLKDLKATGDVSNSLNK